MTEHGTEHREQPEPPVDPDQGARVDDDATGDPVRTGVADVDAVLEAVEGLEGRPLEEHVAVFEDAHGRLRRALDDPGHS